MANKPTMPNFPLGLEAEESSVFNGFTNTGTIEHAPGANMSIPEGTDDIGVPSLIRYNSDTDSYEGFYGEGGWLPFGGGGIRWEMLPHAASQTLVIGRGYFVDNSSAVSTVILPVPTDIGQSITICDYKGKFASFPLTIDPGVNKIYGDTEPLVVSTDNMTATLSWTGPERGWIVTSGVGLGQGRVYSRTIYSDVLTGTTDQITLSYQPSIVDVYVDGKRLPETKYTLDGYNVIFAPALASGADLQILQYTPIQLGTGSGNSTSISWVYNNGAAIGGETSIDLEFAVDEVSEIYVNGVRKQKGIGFEYDATSHVITLTDALVANDEVIVIIGGDPTLYNQIDRTLNEVARAVNLPLSSVILSTNLTSTLDSKTVIFDVSAQKSWGIPSGIPSGAQISSVSGSTLVYNPGAVSVTLIPVPNSADDLKTKLASADGEKLIGNAATISALRTIEPVSNGQRITLREHTSGTGKGGGQFRAVLSGSAYTDNNGTVIKTTGGAAWLRINADIVNPLMFGAAADGTTNDTVAIQSAINTNAACVEYPVGNYLVTAASINCVSNQTHIGKGATLTHTSTVLGYSIFNAFSKVNLKFKDLNFSGPSSVTNAINCVSCNTVFVDNCVTNMIGLFSCKSVKSPNPYVAHDNTSAYSLVTDPADYNYFVTVTNSRVSGDGTGVLGGAFKVAGIHLSYVKYATITGNNINGHKEGIQWLGGDANSSTGNGAIGNPRKCSDISITGNIVIDTVGGIWGSMGQRVAVAGNIVRDCKDVCIDFEGCFDCTATGNSTANAVNGCLTAIFTNKNIVFSGNTANVSLANDSVIGGVYNSLADENNLSVSFIGNTFSNDSGISFLKIEGCQNIVVENNFFNNVFLNTADYASGNTRRYENISGNTMWFTSGGVGYSYSAMIVGNVSVGGTSQIRGNLINGLTSATSQFGILAKASKTTLPAQQFLIHGNTVRGFVNDLIVNAVVPSSGKHLYSIQGNLLNTGGTNVAANSSNIVQANNYKADGTAVTF